MLVGAVPTVRHALGATRPRRPRSWRRCSQRLLPTCPKRARTAGVIPIIGPVAARVPAADVRPTSMGRRRYVDELAAVIETKPRPRGDHWGRGARRDEERAARVAAV